MTDPPPFRLDGPLPEGVTVLEASAGTGKTYTIAGLAVRYVAEGVSLDRLLLVTFTRMATGELRDRVRERLVTSERELARVVAGGELSDPGDVVLALLGSGDREAVHARRERLARALANFDDATIATTHSFCQEVLDELGTLGDLEPDTVFAENTDDLLEQVVDDLYVRRFRVEDRPPIPRSEAGTIARYAVWHAAARLHPLDAPESSVRAMRRRIATAARDELAARKRAAGLMTYDDQLMRLRDVLRGPRGPAAAERLRRRYAVILIDEFQDTDPVQWEILCRAFGPGSGTTLVLIADPKQAIYAFRGADVYAYLRAAQTASRRATLGVNRRSDGPLLAGFDALFGSARLGHPGIVYRRTSPAPGHQAGRLRGAPFPAALRIRVLERASADVILSPRAGTVQADSARSYIARDLAADVVALLGSGAEIDQRDADGSTGAPLPVQAGDIAVLVTTNRGAALAQSALVEAGVPAVVTGAGSVFATPSAGEWLALLTALETPASPGRARAAALTPFLGWSAERVACAGESDLEELHRRLYAWARILRERGVAALAETIVLGQQVPRRLLGLRDGERRLTDLNHVGQLLHHAVSAENLGATALTGWLRHRMEDAERESGQEDRTRRLESDATAVQVLTVHSAKGLEFPIVYLPSLWEGGREERGEDPIVFHDPDRDDERALDVSLEGRAYREHKDQAEHERRGEELRLAYVALTRARHQAIVWWAAGWRSQFSPLARLLLAQDEGGQVALGVPKLPSDAEMLERFAAMAERCREPGAVGVERAVPAPPRGLPAPPPEAEELRAARFARGFDTRWRRTSYSAITAASHELWREAPPVGSEPEDRGVVDEPEGPVDAVVVAEAVGGADGSDGADGAARRAAEGVGEAAPEGSREALPLAAMAFGARVGTLVHRALERVDFTAPALDDEVQRALREVSVRPAEELGCPVQAAAAGIAAALATPLTLDDGLALGDGLALTGVTRADRLDELVFELPLAGGEHPGRRVTVTDIARLLKRWLPADDPLAGYAARLADPLLDGALRGYLTGSIDLALRSADGRFSVVDYKTNWLAGPGQRLTAAHYGPAALAAEMMRSHYGLQALLYSVALHRYLRWRLPGYDPERHLGPVRYLFLRGMRGPATQVIDGRRCGVFTWRLAPGLIVELSQALAGDRR